jgi:hypothetical protein
MEPATIYAITVTLVGFGLPPRIEVEPLPKGWTMEACIKDHEHKLAGRPNTMARCVSRDRPFKAPPSEDLPQMVWVVSIDHAAKTYADIHFPPLPVCERQRKRNPHRTFCVVSPVKPKTMCRPDLGICIKKLS